MFSQNEDVFYFASKNDYEKINQLCRQKHDLDIRNFMGWTPLMQAARNGCLEVVQLLLHYGVDVEAKNKFGKMKLYHYD